MPGKPRMYLPGVRSHVVQRGDDRQACFFEEENYLFYRHSPEESCKRYGVAVHACVLMTNHVHLLMTPNDERGISRVMRLVGNRYVQYVNKHYRRSGALWGGRHKASLVDAERYLLVCYRYIELSPVRAGVVVDPVDYRWSSYRHNAEGEPSIAITAHKLFLAISLNVDERRRCYRELFRAGSNDDEIKRPVDVELQVSQCRLAVIDSNQMSNVGAYYWAVSSGAAAGWYASIGEKASCATGAF